MVSMVVLAELATWRDCDLLLRRSFPALLQPAVAQLCLGRREP
jgi:hypothetical protein